MMRATMQNCIFYYFYTIMTSFVGFVQQDQELTLICGQHSSHKSKSWPMFLDSKPSTFVKGCFLCFFDRVFVLKIFLFTTIHCHSNIGNFSRSLTKSNTRLKVPSCLIFSSRPNLTCYIKIRSFLNKSYFLKHFFPMCEFYFYLITLI